MTKVELHDKLAYLFNQLEHKEDVDNANYLKDILEDLQKALNKGQNLTIPDVRRSAVDWFNRLSLEEQFYKTIEHNGLISGDSTRHPSTLTGREIEIIYLADA